ncbi:DegT/DnrJ/EryC1/StrS family aminotransferase [Halobacillus massiliensis]|uniref:DegT/DnrJ/EryC1/StrS family aminotransferase n=1 Tax=Halobacillus massiliensis TaxID=1926286 RepID=UPI0009E190C0|nr:DegT/DnrJ/EryC1/StrS family aminotransferase [Halobacillus massiliensis]
MLPFIDLKKQFQANEAEILIEIQEVIRSGQYILGPKVNKLERKIADYAGVDHAVGVANGTDALVLTLEAFDIGKGDEVITTPFTFFATGEAIARVGATPVFVDVEDKYYTLDPGKIEEKITSSTKAIMPVHIFGQCADMKKINKIAEKHSLYVIEDACQAFGASHHGEKAGSLGDAACFSFFPTKNLGTMGDGGIILTSHKDIAEKIRMLRVHGSVTKYYHDVLGHNSRLDEIHAAVLLVCLNHLDEWNEQRRKIAAKYNDFITHPLITTPKDASHNRHVYHLYCVKTDQRDQLAEYLNRSGISTGVYYPQCLHLQKAFQLYNNKRGDYPVSETLSESLLAVPIFPYLEESHQDQVIAAINNWKCSSC